MVLQFAESEQPANADKTCKACLLLPGVVDASALPLKTLASALDDGSAPDWFHKYGYACRALAAYRAGDAGQAAHWVRKSQASKGYANSPAVQALVLSLLAMAHHQSGKFQKASEAFSQADRLVEEHLSKLASGTLGGWPDWLIAEILRREASQLIAGPETAPTPEPNATPESNTE
jgi:hypothetical protein